jgi:hypothetical protein
MDGLAMHTASLRDVCHDDDGLVPDSLDRRSRGAHIGHSRDHRVEQGGGLSIERHPNLAVEQLGPPIVAACLEESILQLLRQLLRL